MNNQQSVCKRQNFPTNAHSIADELVFVTDKQYVLVKLKYPDIETLGFYSSPWLFWLKQV